MMPRDWPDPRWRDDRPMHPLAPWIAGAILLLGPIAFIWGML